MRLHTVGLVATLALALLVMLPAAEAQQRARMPRIGILRSHAQSSEPHPSREAFREGLREAGVCGGANVVLEERWATGDPERLPALAAELVRLKVDVIVTTGDAPVRAAKHATKTIPIVMAVSGDPVEAGYVASLARPGGNITGMSVRSPELSTKLLALLKEAVPSLSRVAVLWNAANPVKGLDFRETQRAARVLRVTWQSVEVRAAYDFETAFAAINRARPDAFIALVAASWRMDRAFLTCSGALPPLWTRF